MLLGLRVMLKNNPQLTLGQASITFDGPDLSKKGDANTDSKQDAENAKAADADAEAARGSSNQDDEDEQEPLDTERKHEAEDQVCG